MPESMQETSGRITLPQVPEPNPYSPYATADPAARHVFQAFFGSFPPPDVLALTACAEFAVVPASLTKTDRGSPHAGLCTACVAAMQSRPLPEKVGPVTDCRFCEGSTLHDGVCALCRQEFHEEWWKIRPSSDVVPDGTILERIRKPTVMDSPGARLPDGARLVDDTTVFANPFTVEWAVDTGLAEEDEARGYVVDVFDEWLTALYADAEWPRLAEQRAKVLKLLPDLKGRPLVCSCDLGRPCCGDVLVRLANP